MKDFKFIQNIDKSNNFAEMYLYDEIGFEGINGRQFAYELKWLEEYHEPKLDEIKVRINSVGGSVMDGFSIFSSIFNANKSGRVEVNTYGDGVAASIAGLILMAGKKIYMKDYARLMLHGVSFVNEDGTPAQGLTEKDVQALSVFKDMIKQVFVNNTDIPEEQIEELLSNGKDNWFTAEEAAKAGFIPMENIENTGLELGLPVENDAIIIANKAQKIINKNNFKPLQMKKVIALLGLQEGANEAIVANAVQVALDKSKTAETALTEAQNKITEKDAKIQELQTQVEASNKSVANSIVEAAIKDGKFAPKDDAEKQNLVNQALKDVEGFKTMVALMPTKAANIIDQTQAGNEGASTLIERIKNRSFRQLEREDSALLAEIKNSAKGEYVKLYNAQYNTNKTEADF